MEYFLFDEQKIRYTLVHTGKGEPLNWLFLPGGPGADSQYLRSLIDILDIPGNAWLIDFPNNGNNIVYDEPYDYEAWMKLLVPLFSKFENPICVGHSFGGMLPLLFPELEHLLRGFVVLNSVPSLWLEEAKKTAKQHNIPDFTKEREAFEKHPSEVTFRSLMKVCIPYYFSAETLEHGRKVLENLPMQYRASAWWLQRIAKTNFTALWIPKRVPTLIIGSTNDYMTPFSIYEQDSRFKGENIKMEKIHQAGHFCWIDQPIRVRGLFQEFSDRIIQLRSQKSKHTIANPSVYDIRL